MEDPNTQPQYTNRLPLVCQRVVKNITLAKRTFPTLFPRLSPSVIWTRHLLVFSTSAVSQEMEKTSEYYIWISFKVSPEVWKSFRSANKPLILQICHNDVFFDLKFWTFTCILCEAKLIWIDWVGSSCANFTLPREDAKLQTRENSHNLSLKPPHYL